MKNFAVIENDTVVNVIVADTKEIAESVTLLTCVELTDEAVGHIGDNYVDGVFTRPTPPPPVES